MQPLQLYRQNETQWAFQGKAKEIRILTPGFTDRSADYILAQKIAEYLQSPEAAADFSVLTWTCPADSTDPADINRKWQITDVTKKYYEDLQKDSLIYSREFTDLKARVLEVKPAGYWDAAVLFFKRWSAWLWSKTSEGSIPFGVEDGSPLGVLHYGAFKDPFTKMATDVLQTDETPFVPERAHVGSCRFVLKGSHLCLERLSQPADATQVQGAIKAYRDLLQKSFGWCTIESEKDFTTYNLADKNQFFLYLKHTFDIDFDRMIANGEALLPDHVFKCNIAANNIEMNYVESFFLRLTRPLRHAIAAYKEFARIDNAENLYNILEEIQLGNLFSLREVQGMYESFKKFADNRTPTLLVFNEYLATFKPLPYLDYEGFGEKVRCLTPQAFHQIMEILFVGSGLLEDDIKLARPPESFFTGRKIVHLSISGYKTMGDKKVFDQCRNLFELLHTFPKLRGGNPNNYYELLAHVISKKAVHSSYAEGKNENGEGKDDERVGRLIPFIDDKGLTQWYYVDGFLNDGAGDVNYVLVPACKGYLVEGCADEKEPVTHAKRVPLIKLYRSTASDKEAESGKDSVLADVNPSKVGSLDTDRGDQYEYPYFERCSMPVWVGYLIAGDIDKAVEAFHQIAVDEKRNPKQENAGGNEDNLIDFMNWQRGEAKDAGNILNAFKEQVGEEMWDKFLTGTFFGAEWSKGNKVAQDIHFVGHSLGAALSQGGLYHFGTRLERIPLKGCNYKCFAYDPPGGVTEEEGAQFLQFGRQHKDLLKTLGQHWAIHYQFEYQDFVPQGGPTWLGISQDGLFDTDWLDLNGTIFEPRPTANDIDITTMPTHGRRFHGVPGSARYKEYKKTMLTIRQLFEFKTSYWLSSPLRKLFGYHITTPRLTEELLRKPIGGTIGYAWFWLNKKWADWRKPPSGKRDDNGIVYTSLGGKASVGYVHDPHAFM